MSNYRKQFGAVGPTSEVADCRACRHGPRHHPTGTRLSSGIMPAGLAAGRSWPSLSPEARRTARIANIFMDMGWWWSTVLWPLRDRNAFCISAASHGHDQRPPDKSPHSVGPTECGDLSGGLMASAWRSVEMRKGRLVESACAKPAKAMQRMAGARARWLLLVNVCPGQSHHQWVQCGQCSPWRACLVTTGRVRG